MNEMQTNVEWWKPDQLFRGLPVGWRREGEGPGETLGVLVSYLYCVDGLQMYSYAKNHQILHFKYVQLTLS